MNNILTRERAWQAFTGATAFVALVLQFVLMQVEAKHVGAVWMTLRFFSYFTILSNLLIAVICGAVALAPRSLPGRWCARSSIRGAALLYILVTFTVYHLVLASHWHPQGLAWLANELLHTVVPTLYALGWLWIVPARGLHWRHLGAWLVVPVLYFAWAMLLGQVLRVYPYPFLNLARLGVQPLLRNAMLLLLVFVVFGAIVVVLDLRLTRRTRVSD